MAEFYSGHSETISPLIWWIIAPAFSHGQKCRKITADLSLKTVGLNSYMSGGINLRIEAVFSRTLPALMLANTSLRLRI